MAEPHIRTRSSAPREIGSGKIGSPVWAAIGNTPLVQLRAVTRDLPDEITILAKAEWLNPGGSVKDRPARAIIMQAEQEEKLVPGKTLLDASSGNTALAYAMIGAARGYAVTLCVPENANPELVKTLRAYGARVILTDPLEGSDGAIKKARSLYEEDPARYFYADQYNNAANWLAHYHTTGVEIWEQTGGTVTHFVAGLGTSGTFIGTGRRLRSYNPDITLVSLQPDSPFHGLEGLKHMPSVMVPGIYDSGLADRNIEVPTEDAQQMVKRLSREEGLFVGLSSGAAVVACLEVAATIDHGVIVTVFPDNGRRYIDEPFWEE